MEALIRVGVIGVIAVILAAVLKKSSKELAILLTLAACAIMAVMAAELIDPILSFFSKLRGFAGLDGELLTPVLKTIGIGLLAQLCATVCSDAGENAVAKLIELCAAVLSIYVCLPLLEAVLQMMETMGGGG